MGVRFKVHSYQETTVPVPAVTAEGKEVVGILPAIIVELVPVADYGRTFTYEAPMGTKEDLEAARVLFKKDKPEDDDKIVELGGFTAVTEEQK